MIGVLLPIPTATEDRERETAHGKEEENEPMK